MLKTKKCKIITSLSLGALALIPIFSVVSMQTSVKQNKTIKPAFKKQEARTTIAEHQNLYKSKENTLETIDKKEYLESHIPKRRVRRKVNWTKVGAIAGIVSAVSGILSVILMLA